jgi:L-serine dehydratase
VLSEDEAGSPQIVPGTMPVPFPFRTGAELLAHTKSTGLPISGVMLANELARRDEASVRDGLARIRAVMQETARVGLALNVVEC